MANEILVLVCVLVSQMDVPLEGSEQRMCEDCARAVWVAPDGVQTLALEPAITVCMECTATRIQRSLGMPIGKGQWN